MKHTCFVGQALPPANPALAAALALALLLAGCGAKAASDPAAGAPQPAQVEQEGNADLVKVDHPEQFAIATAGQHDSVPVLNVTGTVTADVSRNVPVISLSSGRILEVHARLGDTVTQGQLLLRVQSADTSSAFSDYRQAVADETLARAQLARSKLLYDKGAIAQKDLEVAQDVADKARITVETTTDRLRVLGADKDRPSPVVDILAPVSGVITDQQVTAASGTQENGRSQGYPVLRLRWAAVFSFVEGRKGSMVLPDGGGLEMHTPALSGGVATGALRLGGEPGAQNACDQQNEWTVHEHVSSL